MSHVNSKLEGFAQKINPALCARVVSGVFYLLAALLTIYVLQGLINGTLFLDIEKPGTFNTFLAGSAVIGVMHFNLRWMLSPSTFRLWSIFWIMAAWLAAPLFFLLSVPV